MPARVWGKTSPRIFEWRREDTKSRINCTHTFLENFEDKRFFSPVGYGVRVKAETQSSRAA